MRSVDELFTTVIRGDDEDARWAAVTQLHELSTREVFERAATLCRSPECIERVAGADVLAQLGHGDERPFLADTLPILLDLLRDEDQRVQTSAIHALGHQRDARIVAPVSRFAQHEADDVRWAVACALSGIEDDVAVKVLIALSADRSDEVRDWATFGLGSMTDRDTPAIRRALFARLEDASVNVVAEAELGLARRHDLRVIPHLVSAVEADELKLAGEAADEITSPEMLNALLHARDTLGDRPGLRVLIARCQERVDL